MRRRQARGHSERRRCWVPGGPQGQAAGDRAPFIKPRSPYPASQHIHETSLLYGLPLALLRQPTNTRGGRGFLALDSTAFSFRGFFHTLKCVLAALLNYQDTFFLSAKVSVISSTIIHRPNCKVSPMQHTAHLNTW